MKKKIVSWMLGAAIASAALSGVSAEETYEEGSAYEETAEEDIWQPTPFRTNIKRGSMKKRETPDENNQVHSYLTGTLKDADIVYSRPMALMINNIINAMPQCGISLADVIYEAPVEGDITRLMAIFDDVSNLAKVGPIRSCRDYFIDFALEFDAIYTHYGQAVYAFDLLNSEMVDNISGLQYQEGAGELNGYAGEDIFFRTDDRPAPHNAYTSTEGLAAAIERKEYDTRLDNQYRGHFKFAADGEIVTYTDGTATYIRPSLYSNMPHFEYDAASGKYLRFQYDGPQIDEMDGSQLAADNVIIQYCPVRAYDDNGYLDVNTVSGGEAVLFTQGTFQRATWKKLRDWGPARYYDAEGNQISINQGKTWVCIVSEARSGDTMFE